MLFFFPKNFLSLIFQFFFPWIFSFFHFYLGHHLDEACGGHAHAQEADRQPLGTYWLSKSNLTNLNGRGWTGGGGDEQTGRREGEEVDEKAISILKDKFTWPVETSRSRSLVGSMDELFIFSILSNFHFYHHQYIYIFSSLFSVIFRKFLLSRPHGQAFLRGIDFSQDQG